MSCDDPVENLLVFHKTGMLRGNDYVKKGLNEVHNHLGNSFINYDYIRVYVTTKVL